MEKHFSPVEIPLKFFNRPLISGHGSHRQNFCPSFLLVNLNSSVNCPQIFLMEIFLLKFIHKSWHQGRMGPISSLYIDRIKFQSLIGFQFRRIGFQRLSWSCKALAKVLRKLPGSRISALAIMSTLQFAAMFILHYFVGFGFLPLRQVRLTRSVIILCGKYLGSMVNTSFIHVIILDLYKHIFLLSPISVTILIEDIQ